MSTDSVSGHVLAEVVENGVNGTISIAPSVLIDIIAVTAESVDGVIKVTNPRKLPGARAYSLTEPLASDANEEWHSGRGIRVRVVGDTLEATLSVTVRAGKSVPETAQLIQERVSESVEKMLGLRTGSIAVHVDHILPEPGQE